MASPAEGATVALDIMTRDIYPLEECECETVDFGRGTGVPELIASGV